jgi:hypothetical protein
MFEEINLQLKQSGLQTASKFLSSYLENENDIVNKLNNHNGLKSELFLHNVEGELEQLKFTSIFSDVTSMYMVSPVKSKHHITIFNHDSPYAYERTVTIPDSLKYEIRPTYNLLPGYSYHTSSDIKKVLKHVDPLLKSSKVLLRPTRTLLVDQLKLNGNKNATFYYADGNTQVNDWVVRDSFGKDGITIENYLKPMKVRQLMELTIPYFRDIKLDKLNNILNDEQDTLAGFRKELKSLILNFDAIESDIQELREDVLRPQISQIERSFKHYKNVHSLTVAGGIAMFSLSLLKINIPEMHISEFINTVIGGAGLSGIIMSEIKYQENQNTLRNNPYFLLWRVNKMS